MRAMTALPRPYLGASDQPISVPHWSRVARPRPTLRSELPDDPHSAVTLETRAVRPETGERPTALPTLTPSPNDATATVNLMCPSLALSPRIAPARDEGHQGGVALLNAAPVAPLTPHASGQWPASEHVWPHAGLPALPAPVRGEDQRAGVALSTPVLAALSPERSRPWSR